MNYPAGRCAAWGRPGQLQRVVVSRASPAGKSPPPSSATTQLPGPSPLETVVGFAVAGTPWRLMGRLVQEGYEDLARIGLGPFGDYVFLLSPTAVRQVVLEKAEAFPERFSVELFETLGLDQGIVYAQGAPHRFNKRACVPSFESSASMATFLEAIQAETLATEKRWMQKAELNQGQAKLDIYAEIRRLTLDVVLAVTFGTTDFAQRDELSDVIAQYLETIVATANEVPPLWQLAPALSPNYRKVAGENGLLARLRELVLALIASRREELARSRSSGNSGEDDSTAVTGPRADLLDALLESGAEDETILYILFDLVIAGSDTTASTVSALLFLLHARGNEGCLAAALEDIASADLENVTLDTVMAEVPYMAAGAKEVLRLYPPVPFIGRRSIVEETVCGLKVPKGSTMCWSPFALGRDPRQWDSPTDTFDPTRFLGDPGKRDSFAWLPFGAGPRGCLGTRLGVTETVVAAARLLKKFEFEFERDDLTYKYDLTLNLTGSCLAAVRARAEALGQRGEEADAASHGEVASAAGSAS